MHRCSLLLFVSLSLALSLAATDYTEQRIAELRAQPVEERIRNYKDTFHNVRDRHITAVRKVVHHFPTAEKRDTLAHMTLNALIETLNTAIFQFERLRDIEGLAAAQERPSSPIDEKLLNRFNFANVELLITVMSVWENTAYAAEWVAQLPGSTVSYIADSPERLASVRAHLRLVQSVLAWAIDFCKKTQFVDVIDPALLHVLETAFLSGRDLARVWEALPVYRPEAGTPLQPDALIAEALKHSRDDDDEPALDPKKRKQQRRRERKRAEIEVYKDGL